jgi:hypothetical protein
VGTTPIHLTNAHETETMAQLSATRQVVINAPPEAVWQIHTNIDDWASWNRSISSAHALGSLAVGSSFEWKSGGLKILSIVQLLEPNRRTPGLAIR